jgi:hypothetical protein
VISKESEKIFVALVATAVAAAEEEYHMIMMKKSINSFYHLLLLLLETFNATLLKYYSIFFRPSLFIYPLS